MEVLSPVTSLAAESGDPSGVFPNVGLTSHEGKSYRFYDDLIKGKKVIINFFYAGCGMSARCPPRDWWRFSTC